jgi:XTP/dITP diphosphohydrolase
VLQSFVIITPGSAMPELVVSTGNPGKLQEMQAYLADTGWQLSLKPATLDIEETGATFIDNAILKARETAIATGKWSIADDSGLEVSALNGAPGIYSARYADNDAARIYRVLQELKNCTDRSAKFVCAVAISQPNGEIAAQFAGICLGEILRSPAGSGGFGYDPIFYVPTVGLSFAEMPAATKKSISHRGQAMALAHEQLLRLIVMHSGNS